MTAKSTLPTPADSPEPSFKRRCPSCGAAALGVRRCDACGFVEPDLGELERLREAWLEAYGNDRKDQSARCIAYEAALVGAAGWLFDQAREMAAIRAEVERPEGVVGKELGFASHAYLNLVFARACKLTALESLLATLCADLTPERVAEAVVRLTRPVPTFEEAWAEYERRGYRYGEDALEQVRFGWKIHQAAIAAPSESTAPLHPNPPFAPTAVCVLAESGGAGFQGLILGVCRRGTTDQWGLPGGKIEPGEDPKAAAVRELFEETRVRVDASELVEVYCGVCNGYVVVTYRAPLVGLPSTGDAGLVGLVGWDKLLAGPFGLYNAMVKRTLEGR